jgi:hypothetical protein
MYAKANTSEPPSKEPVWLEIQRLAFKDDTASLEALDKIVSKAESTSIRLPIIRTAVEDLEIGNVQIPKGQTVILDLVSIKSTRATDVLIDVYCSGVQTTSQSIRHSKTV